MGGSNWDGQILEDALQGCRLTVPDMDHQAGESGQFLWGVGQNAIADLGFGPP